MPRSTCMPNEPTYITYRTSATPINMMRMVLVPAPAIYPNIPEVLIAQSHPAITVASETSSSTDVHTIAPPLITIPSTSTPTITLPPVLSIPTPPSHCPTTLVLPYPQKKLIYAPIATLDHSKSPPASPLPIASFKPNMSSTAPTSTSTASQQIQTHPPDAPSAPEESSFIQSMSTVDAQHQSSVPTLQLQERAPSEMSTTNAHQSPSRCTSSPASSPPTVVQPHL